MKMKSVVLILVLAATWASAQTNSLTSLLQQGLLEEQANQNLDAAIANYQSLATQFDKDRQLAATAVFRIGECYRMQGKTNEAAAQYQRVLHDFADQTTLATLSRQNLTGMGAPASPTGIAQQKELLGEEIKIVEQQLAAQQEQVKVGVLHSDGILPTQQKLLELKRQLAALDSGQILSAQTDTTTDEEDQEIRRIQQMAQNSPDLINARGEGGTTPLQRAASAGWIKVATYLLNHGANIDNVALNNAARVGNRAMVELLLSRGADVNSDFNGLTPLHLAAQNGFHAVVEVLLANKADVNALNDRGETSLFLAAQNGQVKIAQMLLDHKADVNAKSQNGWTPLLIAAGRNQPEVMKLLLAAGANPNVIGGGTNPNNDLGDGRTPLSLAAKRGSPEMVKMLLTMKADPNGGDFVPPLFAAIQRNDLVSAELLLQAGANANAIGSADPSFINQEYFRNLSRHLTPLWLAIYMNQLPTVQLLLKYKADPNGDQTTGNSVLFSALYLPDILETLLTAGGKVETQLSDKTLFLLHNAVTGNWLPAVQILLKHGANVNIQNTGNNYEKGYTPLIFAARDIRTNILETLLNNHADPNIRANNGLTALSYLKGFAKQANSSDRRILAGQMADMLRQHGALDNLPDWDRITVSRPAANFSKTLFYKNTNDWNQVSLYDLIGVQYDLLTSAWGGTTRTFANNYGSFAITNDLSFPDFSNVIIHHPSADGLKWETRKVDLASGLNSGNCGGDVILQFGDVVEISEANHILNQSWNGLTTNELATLKTCLARHLQITVNGQTTNFVAAPQVTIGSSSGSTFAERLKHLQNGVDLSRFEPFMLWPVLDESKTLLSSSDLSQVKVKRHDAATGKLREWTVDCSDPKSPPNFWLRDGDTIEVPERR